MDMVFRRFEAERCAATRCGDGRPSRKSPRRLGSGFFLWCDRPLLVGVGTLLGVVAPSAVADLVGEIVGAPFLEFVGVILGVFGRGDGDLSGFGFGGDISSACHGRSVSGLWMSIANARCHLLTLGAHLREPACWSALRIQTQP